MPPKLLHKGEKVEVRKRNGVVIWYPATVLHHTHTKMHMEYETLKEDDDPTSPLLNEIVSVDYIRPVPPLELHRCFQVGEEVEGLCSEKKGWRKGRVMEILENSVYAVLFESEGQNDRFVKLEQWGLRAFKEWVGGEWISASKFQGKIQKSPEPDMKPRGLILKIKFSGEAYKDKFDKGLLVEIKSDEDGFRGSYYTAVIVEPLGNNKFLVEYRTLSTEDKTELLIEAIDISCIRPCPPIIQRVEPFYYLERVDAWYNDGWWEGHIVKVINACEYRVHFTNAEEEMVFEHCKLRPHQDWIDGKWSIAPMMKLIDEELKTNEVNLKRKYNKKASEDPTFKDGMMVEVKSDEQGYQGSWYCAVIIDSSDSDNYIVEYQTLKTDDESEYLREKVVASYIRPYPPQLVRIDRYKMLEEVDAWYNDGWWVGIVSQVLDGPKYAVYFWTTNESFLFEHMSLRPHQEWTAGKWIVSFREKSKMLEKTRLKKRKKQNGEREEVTQNFLNGMKVEVKSDEEGYRGSWYTATIVQLVGSIKYLVEYLTLKTEDGTELLKEEAYALYIRPCPPIVQVTDEYKPFDTVNAWYNDGWWVGEIYKILEERKYTVYFSSTNEILEFQHSDLRHHQDWINGQWLKGVARYATI